jgi:hypothetical protein
MRNIMKFASLLLASAVMLISCEQTGGDDTSMDAKFYVTSDKNVIQSNGTDFATFSAFVDGKDVTAETAFYLKDSMTPLDGNKLTVDEVGEYSVIGMYGTFYTKDPISVTAIDVPVPAPAEDPVVSNTSFVHRAFLNQYTGTGCGYCPGMVRALRAAFEDEETKNMAVHAAVHSYGAGDPAYIAAPKASGYPYMEIDMALSFSYDLDPEAKAGVLKKALSERVSAPAKVGISANPVLNDDLLVVTVEVKAAETGEYNLGVWFMQNHVYGQQTDYLGLVVKDPDTYNYHENCVRKADSRYGSSYAGYPLGEIKAGKTVQRTFVLSIDKESWKLKDMNNLHFAAFVTAKNGKYYQVVNVVDCKISEPTPYEYK